jgi:hypothetical protein
MGGQVGPSRSWCIGLAAFYCVLALIGCAPRTIADRATVPRTATTVPLTASTVSRSATTVPQVVIRASPIKTASEARIPRPDQSLLEPQPPPDCGFKQALSNPPTAEETRMKLDYEQQCYRHSEMFVRTRLEQLQRAVEEETKPTSRR